MIPPAQPPQQQQQFRVSDATIRAMVTGYFAGTLPPEAANMSDWDVSGVTDMSNLFNGESRAIPPLNAWRVDSVRNFAFMFARSSFDQDLDRWDVSAATRLTGMFAHTRAFNRPINAWNIARAKHLDYLFASSAVFDQPLDRWDVSGAEIMDGMFSHAAAFNQDLDNWDVSNVRSMSRMFACAARFDRPMPSWNVARVLDFSYMFADAETTNNNTTNKNVVVVETQWKIHRDADTREMFGVYSPPLSFKGFTHTVRPADMSKIAPTLVLPEEEMEETASSSSRSSSGTMQEKARLFLAKNPDHLVFQWHQREVAPGRSSSGSHSGSSRRAPLSGVAFTTRTALRAHCYALPNIVFGCRAPGSMRPANINAKTPYLDLRRVKLGPGPVPVAEINHVLAHPSVRMVRVGAAVNDNDNGGGRFFLPAVASAEAMAFNAKTGARCQAETGTQVFALTVLVPGRQPPPTDDDAEDE